MNKRTIVTGASGHIGFHVAECLLEKGVTVILLIRKRNFNTDLLEEKGATILICDLLQPLSYSSALKDVDAFFHIASENTTDTSDEERVIKNTFELSRTVLQTAANAKIPVIIYTSSVVVLGRSPDKNKLITEQDRVKEPESPYVKGKLLAEEFCDTLIAESSADIRRLYPSWVVGDHDPRQTPPHKVIRDFLNNGQRFYFKGGISVAGVKEVAAAHVNAWLKGHPNGRYVVAGSNVTFMEFYSELARQSGKKRPSIFLPKPLIRIAAFAAKIIFGKKSPVDPAYVSSVVGNFSWYDSGKAQKELGYTIPELDDMISGAIRNARLKNLGLDKLRKKELPALKKMHFETADRLLITGFPGWLGNRMLDIFMNGDRFGNNALDRKIRVLVQPRFQELITVPDGVEVAYGDITDPQSLDKALEDVKAVYHLAGAIYPHSIRTYYEINEQGTKNIVDACIRKGVRRILFMSTDSTCGYGREKRIFDEYTAPRPYKNYGKSKYLAEKYIIDKTREGKIDGTSLRGFWFFGPFMPERNMIFFKMFKWKRQIVFGNGKNYRSISHVDNIIQAFVKAEKAPAAKGNWYWIGNKEPATTVNEIYGHIAEGLRVPYRPLHIPGWICELFSILDLAFGAFGKINATVHAAGKFHKDIAGEITAAERDFDYRPDVGFEEIKKELTDLLK
ncbi:MAG: NAD-dependent epimerase/dehydratase family protein [Bacteroidia bacterium]